jgi:glucosamine kinase
VAAIGTGSFIGRQQAGRIDGVGGWGFYLGDQAAGAWLMRRCLEETLLAADALRPVSGQDGPRRSRMIARAAPASA